MDSARARQDEGGMNLQLAQAYQTELRPLCGFLWRMGAPRTDIEDLAHDIFVTAARRWDTFDSRRPLRPWLLGIAYRVYSDARRRPRRDQAQAEAPAAGDELARVEHRRAVERVLAKLPEERRAVFVLHELEGMSAPEISELLDAPLGTIYSRLRQARLEVTAEVRRLTAQEERWAR